MSIFKSTLNLKNVIYAYVWNFFTVKPWKQFFVKQLCPVFSFHAAATSTKILKNDCIDLSKLILGPFSTKNPVQYFPFLV